MNWLLRRPIALLNVLFVVIIGALFFYQLVRHIDVLENWHLELSPVKEYRVIDGRRLAVYHPNETLIFTSSSKKVATAEGNTSRFIVCEPTAELDEREILLDIIPANKEAGISPERASSIILPDVVQFNRLPRICRLVIDITYRDVALWRDHTEHAETEPFIVEEVRLNAAEIQKQIDELNQKIKELESQRGIVLDPVISPQTAPESTPVEPSQQTPIPSQRPAETPPTPAQPQEGLAPSAINGIRDTLNSLLRR